MVNPIPALIGVTGKLILVGVSLKTLQVIEKTAKQNNKLSLRRLTKL